MLNWGLYRLGLLPVLLACAVTAFSLAARPHPLSSTLAPDAFDGAHAYREMQALASRFPQRRAGSPGDGDLASYVAERVRSFGGSSNGGFQVRVGHFEGQTPDGGRELQSVVAERAGAGGGAPIVILAHRDAASDGSQAELSATAVLLELAKVLANSETQRTILLVSTTGGSGGDAGAFDFAAHQGGPFDAAIVLGDLAGTAMRRPIVVPYSDGLGGAPDLLQRTVEQAVSGEAGIDPGGLSVPGQLAHLIFPLTVSEQGPLNAAGIPAVLMQVSGERGPARGERVSASSVQRYGSAALEAIYALDGGPDIRPGPNPELLVQRKVIPGWAVRLPVGALLISPLLVAIDALARLRRRREPLRRAALWTLSLAAPLFIAALFARLLGAFEVVAAPRTAALPTVMRFDGAALQAVLAVVLILVGGWLGWGLLAGRLRARTVGSADAVRICSLFVLVAVSILTWVLNPFAAMLLVPALHLWPPLIAAEQQFERPLPQRLVELAALALALVPLLLLIGYYGDALGMGPPQLSWTAVLLLAGGHVGLPAALLWSASLGAFLAMAVIVATSGRSEGPGGEDPPGFSLRTRGPTNYAGPGSLGGTESALRR